MFNQTALPLQESHLASWARAGKDEEVAFLPVCRCTSSMLLFNNLFFGGSWRVGQTLEHLDQAACPAHLPPLYQYVTMQGTEPYPSFKNNIQHINFTHTLYIIYQT